MKNIKRNNQHDRRYGNNSRNGVFFVATSTSFMGSGSSPVPVYRFKYTLQEEK